MRVNRRDFEFGEVLPVSHASQVLAKILAVHFKASRAGRADLVPDAKQLDPILRFRRFVGQLRHVGRSRRRRVGRASNRLDGRELFGADVVVGRVVQRVQSRTSADVAARYQAPERIPGLVRRVHRDERDAALGRVEKCGARASSRFLPVPA